MLQSLKSGKTIGVYLAHTDKEVSSILFTDKFGKLFYFMSKKLAGAVLGYLTLNKVALVLVYFAKRLQLYFLR